MPGIVNANERIAAALELMADTMGAGLPIPTEADNGKILAVVGGKWTLVLPDEVPDPDDSEAT